MTTSDEPAWKVGDRCTMQMHHPGSPPKPFDAPGTVVRIDRGFLAVVRLDDRRWGEHFSDVQHLRREAGSRR